MWYKYWDMSSGGGTKYTHTDGNLKKMIYVEAKSRDESDYIFFSITGRNADNVTCECCGEDYSVSEEKCLAQSSGYHRGCKFITNYLEEWTGKSYDTYLTLEEYINKPNVLIIRSES